MLLSDHDIQEQIHNGDLQINPFDAAMLKGGSYTFTLNNRLYMPQKKALIDTKDIDVSFDEIDIDEKGFTLHPGDFLLAQTKERVTLPQHIACMLDARTTLARIGLNVLQGSTFIEPGQAESHETLEVSNIGKSPIQIYPGMEIVKGIFFFLNRPAGYNYREQGSYAKQNKVDVIS